MGMKQSPTELLKKDSSTIDTLSEIDALNYMIDDQKIALDAIRNQVKEFSEVVKMLFKHFNNNPNARLIYCGAGTSGRVGVQDGVELYPTFGWPKKKVDFVIAGGTKSLTSSIENSEDDQQAAINRIK